MKIGFNPVHVLIPVLRALSWMPLGLAHALGTLLGAAMARIPSKARRDARVNLDLCFPELAPTEREQLLRRTFVEFGKSIFETPLFWFGRYSRIEGLITNPEIIEVGERLLEKGRGLIVAAPHLGAWELVNVFAARRLAVSVLYRPPRDPRLEPLLVARREHTGARTFPATPSGIRGIYKALGRGETIGILPDQEPRASGVFAPFFGVPAKTMTLLPQMARRSGAPVVFVFAERLPRARGFRIHVREESEAGLRDADPVVATTALNREIEACVGLAPAQYQWLYRRFRERPDGGNSPYRRKQA